MILIFFLPKIIFKKKNIKYFKKKKIKLALKIYLMQLNGIVQPFGNMF